MSASPTSEPVCLGFLAYTEDESGGVQGGYLITNSWGRPVEFRVSSAVQPNAVQRILYGPTLREYVYAELIGKTLLEKCATPIRLLVTDDPAALAIRDGVDFPVLLMAEDDAPREAATDGLIRAAHPHTSADLLHADPADADRIAHLLGRIDAALDLAEPFGRVREAMGEFRKMGGSQRAA